MAKFNWRQPGGKEYLIVGGAALGIGIIYFWWKNRQGQAGKTGQQQNPTSTDASGNAAPGTVINQGGGIDAGGLQSQMRDHQSSPTTAAGGSGGGGVGGGAAGAGGVGGGASGAGAASSGLVPLPAPQQSSVMALSSSSPAASAPAMVAPQAQVLSPATNRQAAVAAAQVGAASTNAQIARSGPAPSLAQQAQNAVNRIASTYRLAGAVAATLPPGSVPPPPRPVARPISPSVRGKLM